MEGVLMRKSKFGRYILGGALLGAVISMFDRSTREQLMGKSKSVASDISFYTKNPEILKLRAKEKTDQVQSLYEQFSGDALYLKEKVDELKTLTPQVKELVSDTKEAFTEAKDEYKSIVSESPTENDLGKQ